MSKTLKKNRMFVEPQPITSSPANKLILVVVLTYVNKLFDILPSGWCSLMTLLFILGWFYLLLMNRSWKEKKWRNLANTILTKWSMVISPIINILIAYPQYDVITAHHLHAILPKLHKYSYYAQRFLLTWLVLLRSVKSWIWTEKNEKVWELGGDEEDIII